MCPARPSMGRARNKQADHSEDTSSANHGMSGTFCTMDYYTSWVISPDTPATRISVYLVVMEEFLGNLVKGKRRRK